VASVYKGRYLEQIIETQVGRIHSLSWENLPETVGKTLLSWDERDAKVAPVAG